MISLTFFDLRRLDAANDLPASIFRDYHWRFFSLDHDEDDAAARFQALYHQPPAYITERGGNLLVGPIPTGE